MSTEVRWDDREKELIQLAFIDEASSYEIDQCGVFFDPKTGKYVVLTASGCSCWDGYADETGPYDTFDDVAEVLRNGRGGQTYNPTLAGVETLLAEALVKDAERKHGQ